MKKDVGSRWELITLSSVDCRVAVLSPKERVLHHSSRSMNLCIASGFIGDGKREEHDFNRDAPWQQASKDLR